MSFAALFSALAEVDVEEDIDEHSVDEHSVDEHSECIVSLPASLHANGGKSGCKLSAAQLLAAALSAAYTSGLLRSCCRSPPC